MSGWPNPHTPQRPHPAGLPLHIFENVKRRMELANLHLQIMLPGWRMKQEKKRTPIARRRVRNPAKLTVDTNLAKRLVYSSCSDKPRPLLTGPEMLPNEEFAVPENTVNRSRKRVYPSIHTPKVSKRRKSSPAPLINTHARLPSLSPISILVQMQRSFRVSTIIRPFHDRWVLAKADQPYTYGSVNFTLQDEGEILTIKIPARIGIHPPDYINLRNRRVYRHV